MAKPLSEEAIARIAHRVLHALNYLHMTGFVHRNVKPENILLTGNDAIPDAYLGGFGFAAERNVSKGEMLLDPVGSLPYLAPELLHNQPYTQAVDMWAFGVVLFIMFTRSMPFPDPEQDRDEWMCRVAAGEWNEDLLAESGAPPAACELIARCLRVNPSERPASAEALESEFFAILGAGEEFDAEIAVLEPRFDDVNPSLN
jgi:serine/threonine protein kinase